MALGGVVAGEDGPADLELAGQPVDFRHALGLADAAKDRLHGERAVLDIGDWGSAIFQKTAGRSPGVVRSYCFAIDPWNAGKVEEELKNLNAQDAENEEKESETADMITIESDHENDSNEPAEQETEHNTVQPQLVSIVEEIEDDDLIIYLDILFSSN